MDSFPHNRVDQPVSFFEKQIPDGNRGFEMIDKIIELIVEQSQKTAGQNAAARLHSVLMEVGDGVGRIIVEEQKKERSLGLSKQPPGKNAC